MALTFELKTCGRCGGSGRYSFNMMHGDRCYGCNGYGYAYSKAGDAAYRGWDAIARPEVPVTDLKIGDKIKMRGYRGAFVILAIEEDCTSDGRILNDGRYARLKLAGNHETLEHTRTYMALKSGTVKLGKTAASHRAAWDAFPLGTPGIVEAESFEAYRKEVRGW